MDNNSKPGRCWFPDAARLGAVGVRLLAALAATGIFPPMALAEAPSQQAHYAGYVLGLHVFDMNLALALQPAAYRIEASFRLAGALGAVWHAEGSTTVSGHFSGGQAVPQEMVSTGRYWGTTHVLRMNWQAGRPEMVQMEPPLEKDREPVPTSDQANTVDTLSAVAALMQLVAGTGRCDTAARTFDGSRLAELSAKTAGQEFLKPVDLSSFEGTALRCDLTVRMTGGFLRDEDNAKAHRPRKATVWFARLQRDAPPIPVRMAFYSEGSPSATAYLR
jgi:hypothetical protein